MNEKLGISQETFAFFAPIISLFGSTFLLFLVMLVLNSLASRFIRRTVDATELRRKWLVQTRNGFILLFILGLILIWGGRAQNPGTLRGGDCGGLCGGDQGVDSLCDRIIAQDGRRFF